MVRQALLFLIKAVPAILSTDRTVNLMSARHPLIPPNVVVPTNIQLGYIVSYFIDYWF